MVVELVTTDIIWYVLSAVDCFERYDMKKLTKLLLLCVLILMLGGCASQDSVNELKIGELCNQAGDFQFTNWEWDSSFEEVQAALDGTFESLGTAGEYEVYIASESIKWNGEKADLICEFKDNQLATVSVRWQPEGDRDEFWTKLQEETIACYGSVEKNTNTSTSEELGITTESENLLWEKNESRHTALMVDKFSSNGDFKYIRLCVYVVPEK